VSDAPPQHFHSGTNPFHRSLLEKATNSDSLLRTGQNSNAEEERKESFSQVPANPT